MLLIQTRFTSMFSAGNMHQHAAQRNPSLERVDPETWGFKSLSEIPSIPPGAQVSV